MVTYQRTRDINLPPQKRDPMHEPVTPMMRSAVLGRWLGFLGLIAAFLFPSILEAEVSAAAGEKLFKTYCAACHKIEVKMVGPALKDVTKRHSEEWLLKWIRNNAALRASGDKDAIAIWTEYGKNEMAVFPQLSDDDVKSILAYIEAPPAAPKSPVNGGDGKISVEKGPSFWLYVVLGILLIIAFLLVRTNAILRRLTAERLGEKVAEEKPFWQRFKRKRAWAFIAIAVVFVMGFTAADSAMRLGHSKNYQPRQPIVFSHALHAGINQINCLYCHAGAEKSKVAGIPPVSTCMNCHKGVQAGQTEEGTAEIQKIYSYYDNNKPIEWKKIHNLPDHVYFNHSQHVVVGKIACQTCHGPIETMEEVKQFASLSMGWCVNCHRETEVQFHDNGYYAQFEQLHEDLKTGKIFEVTEAMVGGAECQRCHY